MKLRQIILASSALFVVASAAHAADGTVTVKGSITASTCKINGGNGNIDVKLPDLRSTALSSVGNVGGRTGFTMSLTECAAGDGKPMMVGAHFDSGASVDVNSGRLNNDVGDGKATGVQVNLLTDDHKRIEVGIAGGQGSQFVEIGDDGAATLNYFAEYYASGAVGAGDVNTRVQYSLTYQ